MRTAIYLGSLILADAILRANTYYYETEMRWLYAAGVLLLFMDLSDWSRSTWDWLHDKDWKFWNWRKRYGRKSARQATRGWLANRRYELAYRGEDGNQHSRSGPADKVRGFQA